MTVTTLAGYAITGRREIWPLFVVVGLLVVVVTGLVIAQLTDPDRKSAPRTAGHSWQVSPRPTRHQRLTRPRSGLNLRRPRSRRRNRRRSPPHPQMSTYRSKSHLPCPRAATPGPRLPEDPTPVKDSA